MTFFKALMEKSINRTPESNCISVGEELFHALAVSFIDVLKNRHLSEGIELSKVLDRFFKLYPDFKSAPASDSYEQQMDTLLRTPRISELVECMANTLKQVALDEAYKNPLKYREVFNGLTQNTKKSFLRDPARPLHIMSLYALAQALKLRIVITDLGAGCGKKTLYLGDNPSRFDLILQQQGKHYFPYVLNQDLFTHVGKLAIIPPQPRENPSDNETLADIINTIQVDNQRLLKLYYKWHAHFLLDEYSLEMLKEAYETFSFVNQNILSDPLQFFAQLTGQDRIPKNAAEAFNKKALHSELAHYFATWISIRKPEQIDHLFKFIEGDLSHDREKVLAPKFM